jgi:CheY-like chemotaxis protein
MRILVVDDYADAADILRELLETLGHEAYVAYSGEEALRVAVARPPDVVLCDLVMPRMDGITLCEALRQAPELANATFVAVTGLAGEGVVDRAGRAGIAHFLMKPFSPAQVCALLARINSAGRG